MWPYVVARAETVVLKGATREREAKVGRRAVRKSAVDDLADMVVVETVLTCRAELILNIGMC